MIVNCDVVCLLQIEECVVCSDKKASVLFQPCGHMCACEGRSQSTFTFIIAHLEDNQDTNSCFKCSFIALV